MVSNKLADIAISVIPTRSVPPFADHGSILIIERSRMKRETDEGKRERKKNFRKYVGGQISRRFFRGKRESREERLASEDRETRAT